MYALVDDDSNFEDNTLFYGQPVKLSKDWCDMWSYNRLKEITLAADLRILVRGFIVMSGSR